MIASPWDRRIERAEELARSHAPAAEVLRFYAEIARLQRGIYEQLTSERGQRPDASALLPHFPSLLLLVKRAGPAPLAHAARELALDQAKWPDLLADQDIGVEEAFFSRALLQPLFEFRASQSHTAVGIVQRVCPFCGEQPQVAVLRGEGDGGKRSLICSLCSTEWDFRRLLCPHCGEEAERQLPVYTTEQFPYVRIEACDTCRTYIKSVDLTKNGLAVPMVEELATLALSLWAEEHEYTKLQLNLLGM
jgi:FdhE protein